MVLFLEDAAEHQQVVLGGAQAAQCLVEHLETVAAVAFGAARCIRRVDRRGSARAAPGVAAPGRKACGAAFCSSRRMESPRAKPIRNWPMSSDNCPVSAESERLAAVDCSTIAAFCCVA